MKLVAVVLLFVINTKLFSASAAQVQSCGRRQGFTGSVVGGLKAKKNEWPWLVAFVDWPDEKFFCGGNLISAKHVLSASHCFQYKGISTPTEPEYVNALIGRHNISNRSEPGSKIHPVWEFILHPDWKFDEDKFNADIAIAVLKDPVGFSNQIQPVCLPVARSQAPVGRGYVIGWGKATVEAHYDETPNKLSLPIVNASYCYTRFPRLSIYSSHRAFCAGYENEERGSCTGDSGGGFLMKDEKEFFWSVYGIVSGSLWDEKYGCDVNSFAIYTNVALFRNRIDTETQRNENINWQTIEVQCFKIDWSGGDIHNCKHDFENDSIRSIKLRLNFPAELTSNGVEGIFMNDLSLKRIPPGIGESAPNLKTFWSFDGKVEFIDRSSFKEMESVNSLWFQNQKLKYLPEDVFYDLKNLTFLRLQNNEIGKLPRNIFSFSPNLRDVNFAFNKLSNLHRDLFAKNLHLEKISFYENRLKKIDVDFTTFQNINVVVLLGNVCFHQSFLNESIKEFQSLVSQSCS